MPVFRHKIFIERPIDRVFAAVADVSTHPKWQAGLIQTQAKDHLPRAGEKGIEVRRMLGRQMRFPYEITQFEPPSAWGFRATEGPIRPSAALSFQVTGDGTTITSRFTIPGVGGWLLGPILLRQQKRNYRRLKELLETGEL